MINYARSRPTKSAVGYYYEGVSEDLRPLAAWLIMNECWFSYQVRDGRAEIVCGVVPRSVANVIGHPMQEIKTLTSEPV